MSSNANNSNDNNNLNNEPNIPNNDSNEVIDSCASESTAVSPKITITKVGNGMIQVTIAREPITMVVPEGVHIDMDVTLPEEKVKVQI